jgi:hypothetical protein
MTHPSCQLVLWVGDEMRLLADRTLHRVEVD